MTPELETCLNYLDHGEGAGAEKPYLPTLRGMIINAVAAECASLQKERNDAIVDCAAWQSCSNAGDDVIDELRQRVAVLEAAVEWALSRETWSHVDHPPSDREWEYYSDELRRRAGGGKANG